MHTKWLFQCLAKSKCSVSKWKPSLDTSASPSLLLSFNQCPFFLTHFSTASVTFSPGYHNTIYLIDGTIFQDVSHFSFCDFPSPNAQPSIQTTNLFVLISQEKNVTAENRRVRRLFLAFWFLKFSSLGNQKSRVDLGASADTW